MKFSVAHQTLRQSPLNIVEFLFIRVGDRIDRQNIDWLFSLDENKRIFFVNRMSKDEISEGFNFGFSSLNKCFSEQSCREDSTLSQRKSVQ